MRKLVSFALLLVLAGCSTSPRRESANLPPDWQSETFTNQPAPVRTNVPVVPKVVAQTNRIAEPWVSLDRWTKFYSLPPFKQINGQPPAFSLTAPEGVLLLRANQRSAFWNGVEIQLGFAPRFSDGQLFINTIDGKKNLLPLLRPAAGSKTNRVLVIDPGHGGADSGARSVYDGRYEKEFTLDCARRLQTLLTTNGWKVFLTRSNDADLSLADRVAFADGLNADLFISIHFNSGAPSGFAGLETYCLTPQGLPSNLTRGYPDELAAQFPNNSFDTENFQLAEKLHRAVLQLQGKIDRGVRRARFMSVLRWQKRPAVLIEGGYLSDRDEAKLIADPGYRQKFAETLAKGLAIKTEPAPLDDNDR